MSGRVRLNAPVGIVPPRTHMFLCVTIDNVRWLIDVGVGGLTPTSPLQLDLLDKWQETSHEARRLIIESEAPTKTFVQQAFLRDRWLDVYEFTQERMPFIDQQVGNWWTSGHRESKFRRNLLVALARPDGTRLSILNNEFTHRCGPDVLETFTFDSREHLVEVLADRCSLDVPERCDFTILGFD